MKCWWSWLREATSDEFQQGDIAYGAIAALTGAAIGALGFLCSMSAIAYFRCVPLVTPQVVVNCTFDPLPLGQAAGLIFGAFGALIGALSGYMLATRRPPRPQLPPQPPTTSTVTTTATTTIPAEAATDVAPTTIGPAVKGKQRGFGDLWLIAGIAVGAAVLISGVYVKGRTDGINSQKATDTPLIQAAEAEKAVAIEANKGLQSDLAHIREDVNSCNQRVAAVKADSDIAVAQMQQIISQSEERKTQYAKALARFEAAAKPAQPVAPDQQCAAAKAALQDLSDEMKAIDALGLAQPTATVRVTPAQPAKPASSIFRRVFPAPAK